MKALIWLLCAVLVLPSVLGVGIGLPQDLEEVVYVDEGDDWTYTFLLKGDADEQDVQFYVLTAREGVVEVNGNEDGYTKNYNLDPYEDVSIDIDFQAIGGGRISIIWGFKYLGSGDSDDGFSFEQAMQKTFIVEVDGDGSYNEYIDVEVNTNDDDDDDDSTTGSAGGAGGGGGAGAALLEVELGPDAGSNAGSGEDLQDISAQGSATSEMVAGADGPEPQSGIFGGAFDALAESGAAVGDAVAGKGVLMVLLVFLVGGMVTSLYAAKMAKEDA